MGSINSLSPQGRGEGRRRAIACLRPAGRDFVQATRFGDGAVRGNSKYFG